MKADTLYFGCYRAVLVLVRVMAIGAIGAMAGSDGGRVKSQPIWLGTRFVHFEFVLRLGGGRARPFRKSVEISSSQPVNTASAS
jgi:hypothetical protein